MECCEEAEWLGWRRGVLLLCFDAIMCQAIPSKVCLRIGVEPPRWPVVSLLQYAVSSRKTTYEQRLNITSL